MYIKRRGSTHLAFFIFPILNLGFFIFIFPNESFLKVLPLLPIILGLIKTDSDEVVVIT